MVRLRPISSLETCHPRERKGSGDRCGCPAQPSPPLPRAHAWWVLAGTSRQLPEKHEKVTWSVAIAKALSSAPLGPAPSDGPVSGYFSRGMPSPPDTTITLRPGARSTTLARPFPTFCIWVPPLRLPHLLLENFTLTTLRNSEVIRESNEVVFRHSTMNINTGAMEAVMTQDSLLNHPQR